jgi:hypothetical protein
MKALSLTAFAQDFVPLEFLLAGSYYPLELNLNIFSSTKLFLNSIWKLGFVSLIKFLILFCVKGWGVWLEW